jgi:hypothetical protein
MDSIDMFPVQLCPCLSTEQTRDLTVCSSSDAPDVAPIGTGRSIVSRKANISYVLRHEALLHRRRPSRHSGGAFIICLGPSVHGSTTCRGEEYVCKGNQAIPRSSSEAKRTRPNVHAPEAEYVSGLTSVFIPRQTCPTAAEAPSCVRNFEVKR